MDQNRLPQIVLYGEMRKKRPAHGPKKRWRDLVSTDLQNLNLSDSWQELCLDSNTWYKRCQEGISQLCPIAENLCAANNQPLGGIFTCLRGRTFRRAGDCKRHQKFYKIANSKSLL